MASERLSCGCRRDGEYLCYLHRVQPWWDRVASDAAALVSLALFLASIAAWAAILGG